MKVAHVTATFPPYWGGTGNVAYHNARVLHERGHEVTVFTARVSGQDRLEFPFVVEYLDDIFRIGNAPLTPELFGRLKGFDVIHLHYPYIFGAEIAALASRAYAIPVVATYHNDLLSPGWKGFLFSAYSRLVGRWVLSRCSRVAATSRDYAKYSQLALSVNREEDVYPLPNGVDDSLFLPLVNEHADKQLEGMKPGENPFVLFVGGMDRPHFFKGIPVLIEAMSSVSGADLVLVGDGELRSEYEQIADVVLSSRVRFVGRASLTELVGLYQRAAVTVLPSTTMGEAFGIVLIESLACGTPVIASDLPGVRTVVSEGIDGFLVRPGQSEGLAEAIHKVLFESDYREMGSRGRRKVEQMYSWSVIGDLLETLYVSVVNVGPNTGVAR